MGKTEGTSVAEGKPMKAAKATGSRKAKVKKPGMPRRPLSAYNLFFKEERARLLAERDAQHRDSDEKQGLFETMAKTVAKRWKEISPERMRRYQEEAMLDSARYRREMEEYSQRSLVDRGFAEPVDDSASDGSWDSSSIPRMMPSSANADNAGALGPVGAVGATGMSEAGMRDAMLLRQLQQARQMEALGMGGPTAGYGLPPMATAAQDPSFALQMQLLQQQQLLALGMANPLLLGALNSALSTLNYGAPTSHVDPAQLAPQRTALSGLTVSNDAHSNCLFAKPRSDKGAGGQACGDQSDQREE